MPENVHGRRDSGRISGSTARRLLVAALAVYIAFVLFVTLTPRIPGTGTVAILVNSALGYFHDRGLLIGVGYDDIEFLANIGMFVPLGVLAVLLWRAWWVLPMGTALSGFVELYQSLLLPGRVGEWRDVLSNSIGYLVGAGIVLVVRAWGRRGD
ncbi:MAG: VanZ family protein [Rhodoglobus sp.]|nr:VanZ family protein [Rhodoglobus sp.]